MYRHISGFILYRPAHNGRHGNQGVTMAAS